MGPQLGVLYHELDAELTWMHMRWRQHRILFGSKPERIDLLNEAAPFFFRVVQDMTWEDTVLAVARITDARESCGKRNLSVRALPALLDPPLREEVEALVETAARTAQFARDWRNRHIAHRDLEHVLDRGARPLANASRQAVEEALRALRDVLNRLAAAFLNSTTAYEHASLVGDAECLLYVLHDGVEHERARQARFERGDFAREDWAPRPPL